MLFSLEIAYAYLGLNLEEKDLGEKWFIVGLYKFKIKHALAI
jgi:hypothetical protein